MRRRSRTLTAVAAAVVFAAALTGCQSGGPDAAARCVPERMTVTPAQVSPGQDIVLAAPPASCGLDLGPTVFELRIQPSDTREPHAAADARVAPDGSFSVTLTVPDDFPPGAATAFLVNYDVIDWCPGYSTPQAAASVVQASCAAYDAAFTVVG